MVNNWKPKDGDWIIHQVRDGYNDYSESLVIYYTNSNIVPIRSAILSDFATEISDYGKVWVIEYDNYYIIKPQAGRQFMHYKDKDTISIETLLIKSFIRDRNVTVMDEATFKKLSEE